jgi:F0F1-type ATP synthase beta subunit
MNEPPGARSALRFLLLQWPIISATKKTRTAFVPIDNIFRFHAGRIVVSAFWEYSFCRGNRPKLAEGMGKLQKESHEEKRFDHIGAAFYVPATTSRIRRRRQSSGISIRQS